MFNSFDGRFLPQGLKRKKIVDTGKEVVKDVATDIGKDVVKNTLNVSDSTVNKIIDAFKIAKVLVEGPAFEGERHAVLRMPDGSYKRAQFMG